MSQIARNGPEAPGGNHRLRQMPLLLIVLGAISVALGWFHDPRQLGFSYLLAFMFYLSICLGSLFLVLVHHLFDSGWSVPMRRFLEHLSFLLPVMLVLFIPLAILAPQIYPWMTMAPDHALLSKRVLLNQPVWYGLAAALFLIWSFLSWELRRWSLRQDATGEALCTYRMRFHSGWGIVFFAFSTTAAAILWMQSLQHQWYSTMYGVYYFAGSTWLAIATAYALTVILHRLGYLPREILRDHQYYFLGSLLLAFTVFYAYIHFSQYFIIWNGNMPEETWWYVLRETGTWRDVGLVLIFGHFFLPFLALLRIDGKHTFALMIPLCIWAWLMHWTDLAFNIGPVLHPDGFVLPWTDLGCLALLGGILAEVFIRLLNSAASFPIKDPRLYEAMGFSTPVPTQISGGELDEADERFRGGYHPQP